MKKQFTVDQGSGADRGGVRGVRPNPPPPPPLHFAPPRHLWTNINTNCFPAAATSCNLQFCPRLLFPQALSRQQADWCQPGVGPSG